MTQKSHSIIYPSEWKHLSIQAWMFIGTLFIIADKLKTQNLMFCNLWADEVWYIHTVEYYSAIKSDETIVTCNVDEYQVHFVKGKKPYCLISFRRHSGKGKTIGTEHKSAVAKRSEWGREVAHKEAPGNRGCGGE